MQQTLPSRRQSPRCAQRDIPTNRKPEILKGRLHLRTGSKIKTHTFARYKPSKERARAARKAQSISFGSLFGVSRNARAQNLHFTKKKETLSPPPGNQPAVQTLKQMAKGPVSSAAMHMRKRGRHSSKKKIGRKKTSKGENGGARHNQLKWIRA